MGHLLADPNCAVITDTVGADFRPINPAPYGAFTKVLGFYARDKGLMTQEEAVRKMTSLPAQKLRLNTKGLIAVQYDADLVIFNPKTVIDRSTYEDPRQYPDGIDWVLVNGSIVVERGKHTDLRPGKSIRANGH